MVRKIRSDGTGYGSEKNVLGLELGSTRIKAVLLDENHLPIASGGYDWENKLANGIWTYDMADIHAGLQGCFAALAADVEAKFGQKLTTVGAIGISRHDARLSAL